MADARFSDADPGPLHLGAADIDDLRVLSALLQDAVLSVSDIAFDRGARRLALLVNRFRWEDRAIAEGRAPAERVRALLLIGDAMAVRSEGFDKSDRDLVLSLLSLDWQPGEDGTGQLALVFSGDGQIAVEAESINLDLRDVTAAYAAPSGQVPRHPD